MTSNQYVGWDPEEAVIDYKVNCLIQICKSNSKKICLSKQKKNQRRIKQHEENYETITDTSFPFVKNMNAGEQFIVNNVIGYLQVVSYRASNNGNANDFFICISLVLSIIS